MGGVGSGVRISPLARNRKVPGGCPELSRARVLRAAKRTLDGEDSRQTIDASGRGRLDQEKFPTYCSCCSLAVRKESRSRAERMGRAVAHLSLRSNSASS